MFVAFAAVVVCCMVGLPFVDRWAYHQSRKDPILRDYPRIYYVLAFVVGEAAFVGLLVMAVTFAATIDFHRSQPPFPAPITATMVALLVASSVIGIASLIPMAVIVVRVHNVQRKR